MRRRLTAKGIPEEHQIALDEAIDGVKSELKQAVDALDTAQRNSRLEGLPLIEMPDFRELQALVKQVLEKIEGEDRRHHVHE